MMKSEKSAESAAPLRVNPIELAIFAAILGVFGHSVYSLFQEKTALLTSGMLGERRAEPTASQSTDTHRSPASADRAIPAESPLLARLETTCETLQNLATPAPRLRLSGHLCGTDVPKHTTILNRANQSQATVFTDVKRRAFTTDYIPLVDGKNPIQMTFTFAGGSEISSQIEVTRGPASATSAAVVAPQEAQGQSSQSSQASGTPPAAAE